MTATVCPAEPKIVTLAPCRKVAIERVETVAQLADRVSVAGDSKQKEWWQEMTGRHGLTANPVEPCSAW